MSTSRKRGLFVSPLWLALLAWAHCSAQEVTLAGSVRYLHNGLLADSNAQAVVLLTGVTVKAWGVRMSVNVPVISQETRWMVATGSGAFPSPFTIRSRSMRHRDTGSGRPTSSQPGWTTGPGDPVFTVGGNDRVDDNLTTGATLSVKAPVASVTDGMSTGEWDFGAALSISQRFGSLLVGTEVSYWILGDPVDFVMLDPISLELMVGYRGFDSPLGLYATGSLSSAVVQDAGASGNIAGALLLFPTDAMSLSAGISVGLTKAAVETSFSLGWNIVLAR